MTSQLLVPLVFAVGAISSSFPLSTPSILTVTGAGFCIARGVVTDVTTVQNGA